MKKAFFAILLAIVPFSASPAPAAPLRVGVLPVVDILPLVAAVDEGLFDRSGLPVELVPFQSALERDAAMTAGQLDGYFGDVLNTVLLIRSGVKLKAVTTVFATNPEHRMFGIAASGASGITGFAGLQGKSVAISRATVIEYLLDRMIAFHGKAPDFVQKEDIKKIPIRLQMLISGQVDAALLPEPLLTLAEAKGAVVVADDRELSASLTVIALTESLLEKKPDAAARFLSAFDEAVARINADPERYKKTLVTKTRFPALVKDRYRVPVFPVKRVPSRRDISDVARWIQEMGMGETSPAYEDVVLLTPGR